jgi:hypothetical protein
MSDMALCREARIGDEHAGTYHVTEKSRQRHAQLTATSRVVRSVRDRRAMA